MGNMTGWPSASVAAAKQWQPGLSRLGERPAIDFCIVLALIVAHGPKITVNADAEVRRVILEHK